jgi:hypothetical protein
VLPLEYEQASQGSSETTLIQDTVSRASAGLPAALDDAPWLGDAQRRDATNAVRAVETVAHDRVPPAQFDATAAKSVATLESVFGLPQSGGG